MRSRQPARLGELPPNPQQPGRGHRPECAVASDIAEVPRNVIPKRAAVHPSNRRSDCAQRGPADVTSFSRSPGGRVSPRRQASPGRCVGCTVLDDPAADELGPPDHLRVCLMAREGVHAVLSVLRRRCGFRSLSMRPCQVVEVWFSNQNVACARRAHPGRRSRPPALGRRRVARTHGGGRQRRVPVRPVAVARGPAGRLGRQRRVAGGNERSRAVVVCQTGGIATVAAGRRARLSLRDGMLAP